VLVLWQLSDLTQKPQSSLGAKSAMSFNSEGGELWSRVALVFAALGAATGLTILSTAGTNGRLVPSSRVSHSDVNPSSALLGGVLNIKDSALDGIDPCLWSSAWPVPLRHALLREGSAVSPPAQQADQGFCEASVPLQHTSSTLVGQCVKAVVVQGLATNCTTGVAKATSSGSGGELLVGKLRFGQSQPLPQRRAPESVFQRALHVTGVLQKAAGTRAARTA